MRWLAREVGVSRVTVHNWAAGRTRPSHYHARRAAELLNIINPEVLFPQGIANGGR